MDALGELYKRTRPASIVDLRQASSAWETHLGVFDEQRYDNEFLEIDLARRIATVLIAACGLLGRGDFCIERS